jgi:hypothetical protein
MSTTLTYVVTIERDQEGSRQMSDTRAPSPYSGESLLFLTDEQLRQGIEAMFLPIADSPQILIASCQIWPTGVRITALCTLSIARRARR